MKRSRLWLVAVLLLAGSEVAAECQPWGRKLYTAGLEALSAGDLAAASRSFYMLVGAEPDCAEAHNNLAVVFVEQGRIEEAQVELHAALRARPDYVLAQRNLAQLETLLAARAQRAALETEPVVVPAATPEGAAPSPTVHRALAPSMQPPTPTAPTSPTSSPAGNGGVNLRPPAVCIIEPAQNRLCLHEGSTASGGAVESCYAIQAAEVRAWPRWLVASEILPKRIRLLDETGQTRLEIIAPDTPVTGDVLRLQQADFDALAAKLVPWSTKWVVLE